MKNHFPNPCDGTCFGCFFSGCVSKAPPVEDTQGIPGYCCTQIQDDLYCKKYGSKFLLDD